MKGPATITWPDGSNVSVELDASIEYFVPDTVFNARGHVVPEPHRHTFNITASGIRAPVGVDFHADVTVTFEGIDYRAALAGCRITPEAYVYDLVALEDWALVREEACRGRR